MKVSLNWLKYYVDIDVTVEELCNKMTLAGFEIEELTDLSQTMKNVVVGKIEKIEKHPDSDHLQICQVNVGKEEPVQIITGAQNVFEGAYVPAALHKSLLPNGMKITKGKLRGLPSNGMLCSGEELCLTDSDYEGASVNGIMILHGTPAPGTDMKEILNLDDYIIDFSITSNRPDCQSVLGIAREVSVVLGKEFKMPLPKYETVGGDINNYITLENRNYDLCPRYLGRVVKNLRIKESPEWLKKCVRSAGMRPINNIVDITNFVMLETGMPMHAFDKRDIKGDTIIIRNASDGEKIITLDEKEHELNSNMLVIADAEAPSCLAGIMGSANSGIKNDTSDLLLECAKFRRDNIRKTARALGMRTEASGRFEHGVDINNVEYAMNRALQLIYDLDAGDIIDGSIDLNRGLPEDRELTVSAKSVCDLLGIEIPSEIMVDILNRLGIKTTLENGNLCCLVPSFRDDIEGRADIAEEVIRIYGYDHMQGTEMKGAVMRGKLLPERICSDRIKRILINNGMREIATYSFIGARSLNVLNLEPDDYRNNMIKILNPLGEEYSVMRTQLITSMLTTLSTNASRKIESARMFELSKVFIPKQLPATEQPYEIPTLSLGMYGKNESFFTVKGIIEDVYEAFGMEISFERSAEPFLHPGRQANVIFQGEPVAYFGELHPSVSEKLGFDTKVYVAEVKLLPIYTFSKPQTIYKALPKFPAVTRDIALICDADIPVADLSNAIKSGAGSLCEKVSLFDVYQGSQIPEGKKSVAYSLTLRSANETLTDETVEKVMGKVFEKLEALGANLRK